MQLRIIGIGFLLATSAAGTHSAETPGDAISHVRQIDTWVDLSGARRPVAILCPDRPRYWEAARQLADELERRGVPRPLVSSDAEQVTPQRYQVVALGNVNNNRLIARLYFNCYACEDSLIPGTQGFSVRCVYDPYPWHGQGHVLVVGLSDERCAADALAWLSRKITSGKSQAGVDYLLYVSTAPPLTPAQVRSIEAERTPSFHAFWNSASKYLKTGREPYARHAIATLERIVERYRGPSDHDCDWPEETHSAEILATWDAFEECPLMTAGQRLEFTRALLQFMRSLVRHVSGYSSIGQGDLVTWNHTTFPLLGLYCGGRYFGDYYRLPEAPAYLAKARACLLAQARSWKPQEDADSYLTITMRHMIQYCLAEWNLEFFESGRLRQYADYVVGICDSGGLPAGFGDSGIGLTPAVLQSALPIAFGWYRDPGYLWILEHASQGKWDNPFHRDVRPQRPSEHAGVRAFPLDPQLYEYTRLRPVYNEPPAPPNVPPTAAFDKIAFREHLDRDAQYLLLDGYARGKHLHFDGNAIIELVDRGQRWLIDHDYLTRSTTEHNMLSVIRDGRSPELIPSCAGLECLADVGGDVGLVGTSVRDYNGVDWQRFLFWQKGEVFVVLDRATAREDSHYDLDLVWKMEDRGDWRLSAESGFTLQRPAPESDGSAPRFCIRWPDAGTVNVTRSHPKGIAVPVLKVHQRRSVRLKQGGTAEFANLLYTAAGEEAAGWDVQALAPGAVLVHTSEDAVCAVRGARIGGLTFDADMLYVSPSRIAWAKGRSVALGQASLRTGEANGLEMDVVRGRVVCKGAEGQTLQAQADGMTPDRIRRWLDSLAGRPAAASASPEPAWPSARAQWTARLENGDPVRRLKVADLEGEGRPHILAAAGNGAFALRANGALDWSYLLERACYDVEAGELASDGGFEVAVAGGDAHGHLLDRKGRLLSKHPIRGAVWNQNFGDRPWEAYTVAVRDLDQNGTNEILLGTQNFELHIYDPAWKLLSRTRRAVLHGSIDFFTADADGDGKLEIFATDHYGHVHVFRHDGTSAGDFYTSIGDACAVLAERPPDRKLDLIYGSSSGDLVCVQLPSTVPWSRGAVPRWRFDNFGYGANRLRAADLDGDGNVEVVIASQTGYLYVLDKDGRVRWQDRAGTDIVEALVLREVQPQLAYLDRGGLLTLATGDGATRKRISTGLVAPLAVQHGDLLVVGAGCELRAFSIASLWTTAR